MYPEGIAGSCCGMLFNSRGFASAAAKKMSSLEESLLEASDGGKLPIICDTSPCLAQIKTSLSTPALRFALYEPVEFINHFLVDKLEWKQVRATSTSWPRFPAHTAATALVAHTAYYAHPSCQPCLQLCAADLLFSPDDPPSACGWAQCSGMGRRSSQVKVQAELRPPRLTLVLY